MKLAVLFCSVITALFPMVSDVVPLLPSKMICPASFPQMNSNRTSVLVIQSENKVIAYSKVDATMNTIDQHLSNVIGSAINRGIIIYKSKD